MSKKREGGRKFAVGEQILSRWPGSSKSYRAKILNIKGAFYDVQFEDSTIHTVNLKDVKELEESPKVEQSRRVTRSRSRSPSATVETKKIPAKKVPALRRSSRSRSRERRTAPKPSPKRKPPEQPQIRTSPRVRVSRVNVRPNYNEDDKDDEDFHPVATLRNSTQVQRKTRKSSPPPSSVTSTVKAAAKVAAVVAPKLMDVVTSGEEEKISKRRRNVNVERSFGASFAAFVAIFTLPALIYLLNIKISQRKFQLELPVISSKWSYYVDGTAAGIYLTWLLLQFLLYTLPVGRLVKGNEGTRLKYRLNGLFSLFNTALLFTALVYFYGFSVVDLLLSKWNQLLLTSIVVSYILALILYLKARRCPEYARSPYGSSGNFFYDYYMGRELNPSFLGFDLKMFLELRPGLVGWMILNVCILIKDWKNHGAISSNLAVSVALQLFYCLDAFYYEENLISTMDISSEGLGFMLVFGDLSFVPFIFTVESRYLLSRHLNWSWYCHLPIVILALVGYVVFRLSNNQKNNFRQNPLGPKVAHLATISTGVPKKLLVGGWWAWLRHPNYLGDILMALAFCLPSGFLSAVPYTYLLYLVGLLCHRALRDDAICAAKYGIAWETYKKRVSSRIFPHIF